jgi:predicted aspartyl protease
MLEEMGIFRTTVEFAPWNDHTKRREVRDVMVDTGSEYTWLPRTLLDELGVTPARIERFEAADGRILEREIGFAMVFAGGRASPTIVVFAGEGDMVLLGALALEGMNLRVDLVRRELVPAGPVPVALTRAAFRASTRPLVLIDRSDATIMRTPGRSATSLRRRSRRGQTRALRQRWRRGNSWCYFGVTPKTFSDR